MNLSYLTGRLVKSGPTNVGLVIIRFHPENCKYYTFRTFFSLFDHAFPESIAALHKFMCGIRGRMSLAKDKVRHTLLRSLFAGLDDLEHFLFSNTSDLR